MKGLRGGHVGSLPHSAGVDPSSPVTSQRLTANLTPRSLSLATSISSTVWQGESSSVLVQDVLCTPQAAHLEFTSPCPHTADLPLAPGSSHRCVSRSVSGHRWGVGDPLEQHHQSGLASSGRWEGRGDVLGVVLLEAELRRRVEPRRTLCTSQLHP